MKKLILLCALFWLPVSIYCMENNTNTPTVVSPGGEDFVTALYDSYGGLGLYISKEKLFDAQGKPVNLKVLFEKYQIVPEGWDDKTWEKATEKFTKEATEGNVYSLLTLDSLPELLRTAKFVAKKFLLTDDSELPAIKTKFIEKTGLHRLFTYAKMQHVIQQNGLSHVRLPRKVLVIKNIKTGEFVLSKEAPKVIDDILKIYMRRLGSGDIRINNMSDDYELIIFANREKNHYVKFNQEARKDLEIICQKAPFDVGYDNIFTDSNGDAVIIDTENKGESSENCLKKLNRYF